MPTYEYQCKACGHTLEEFHSITEPPLTRCPKCDTDNLVRIMGTGAGLIFRGTGFYLTDYKKSSGSPATSGGSASGKQSGGSADSKPAGEGPGSASSQGGPGGGASGGSATSGGSKDSHGGS